MILRKMILALAAALAIAGVTWGLPTNTWGHPQAANAAVTAPKPPAEIHRTATVTGPVQFGLYANGGSTATWDSQGRALLTASSTFGASAQVDVLNPPATAPSTAPFFETTVSGGGDPRYVMEFHNGEYMFGYPAAADSTAALAWQVEPGDTSSAYNCHAVTCDYATALADAQGYLDDQVTAAFIVQDSGVPGVPTALSNVQYNGVTLPPTGFVTETGITGTGTPLAVDDRGGSHASGAVAQVWQQYGTTGSTGVLANQSFQPFAIGTAGNFGLRLMNTNLCLDVVNGGFTNGTKVQLWSCGAASYSNQQWATASGGVLQAMGASAKAGHAMALDDPAGGKSGTGLQIWSVATGTARNQQWATP